MPFKIHGVGYSLKGANWSNGIGSGKVSSFDFAEPKEVVEYFKGQCPNCKAVLTVNPDIRDITINGIPLLGTAHK